MKDYRLYMIAQPKTSLGEQDWAYLEASFPPVQMTFVQSTKLEVGRFLHRFGFHYWVLWKQYDAGSGRVLDIGSVCSFCPTGRLHT